MSSAQDTHDAIEATSSQTGHAASTGPSPATPAGNDASPGSETETLVRTVVLLGYLSTAAALLTMMILLALGIRIWSVVPMFFVSVVLVIVDRYARRRGVRLPPPFGRLRQQSSVRELVYGVAFVIVYAADLAMFWYQESTGHPLLDVGFVKHETPDPSDDLSMYLFTVVPFAVIVGAVTAYRCVAARNREREQRRS